MGAKKIVSIVLIAVGLIVLLVSVTADLAGLGRAPAFGIQQIIGAIVGGILAVIGLVLILRK